jgi:hypothetical protein
MTQCTLLMVLGGHIVFRYQAGAIEVHVEQPRRGGANIAFDSWNGTSAKKTRLRADCGNGPAELRARFLPDSSASSTERNANASRSIKRTATVQGLGELT